MSSIIFFWQVVVKLFDYFWKLNSLFSKFCVNCLFLSSTSYTVLIVLWKMLMEPVNAPACWWPCACLTSVSGLRRLERNFNFLRRIHVFDMVLKYGSDINEGNWLQLLLYFIVLMGIVVASVIGMTFFSYVSGFRLKFCRIALWRKRLQLDSKSDLTTKGLILGVFCWKMASFVDFISVWTEICINCSIVFLFWRQEIFSKFSLRGILVCSLKLLVLFRHRIL